ncbi:MAG: hypothetical protein Q8867_06305 [Bacteroidota bacterium]|nr:hypothetical protein [Bacteroidota bacterium]
MKKIYLFVFILCIALSMKAQYPWTPAVPVTDSITDNKNVNIFQDIYSMPPVRDSVFMVWEKSTDSLSTEIWCRNLQTMGTPFPLLSQPGVHFRNPVIGQETFGDTLLYVFYETDLNGNEDIYYIKYLADGTISSPVPVRNTPQNETNLKYSNNFPGILWEEDGKIVYQPYSLPGGYGITGDTVVLARGNCHNPVMNSEYCAWEKQIGNETQIYYSNYSYSTQQWSAPNKIVDSGVNKNLNLSESSIFPGNVLLWQSLSGGYWKINGYDLGYGGGAISPFYFENSNNTQPAYYFAPLIVKQSWPDFGTFYTFVSDTTGDNEIFINSFMGYNLFTNFSNHPSGADVHPNFSSTGIYNPPAITIFLTWESYRNGHWQIWMSDLDWYLGIPDKKSQEGGIVAYPNPSKGDVTFEYKIAQKCMVSGQIISSTGRVIRSFSPAMKDPGKQKFYLDRNDPGSAIAPGLYVCIINLGDRTLQKKFVLY